MTCDIFLSYSSVKDLYGAVGAFRDHMEQQVRIATGDRELTIFQDKRDIHGGDKWEEILKDEIRSAKVLLILLSPIWLTSEWCRREYCIFRDEGITNRQILPLKWSEVEESDLTQVEEDILKALKAYQIVDWTHYANADWRSGKVNAAAKLADSIRLLLKNAKSAASATGPVAPAS